MSKASENVYQDITDRAITAHKAGKFADAIHLYNRLLNRNPEDKALRFYLADALLRTECNGLAINLLQQLVRKHPDFSQAWCNMGVGYRKEYFVDEAKAAWLKALAITGDTEEVCGNMAGLYADTGNPKDAIHWCDRALKCNPESIQAHWHKGLAQLTLRDLMDGWHHYEYRRMQDTWDSRKLIDAKDWQGEPLSAKDHIYLHGEQGVGDEIMFLGCLPKFLEENPAVTVTVEVNKKVAGCVKATWPDINVVTDQKFAHDQYTYKCPLGTLPKFYWKFLKSVSGEPYIRPEPDLVYRYQCKLEEIGPRPWVALAWMGGAKSTNVLGRSLPIETYRPLMDLFTCVSCQYEDVIPLIAEERADANLRAIDIASCGSDLAAQAALMEACDIVVTVPQTVMHVAGAVGVECYVLTPDNPDWRFGIEGETMPWYKSVKILRKGQNKNWYNQIERLIQQINRLSEETACLSATNTEN
jgi:ADP-heptose:LPS heptosyltransferase